MIFLSLKKNYNRVWLIVIESDWLWTSLIYCDRFWSIIQKEKQLNLIIFELFTWTTVSFGLGSDNARKRIKEKNRRFGLIFHSKKKFKSHYFLVHYCYVSRVELAFLNKRKWKKCCYQFWGIPNYEMERVYLVPEKSLNQSECCSRKKNPKSVQEVAQIVIWRFFWGDILNVANS